LWEHEIGSIIISKENKVEFLKVGPNGGTNPRLNRIGTALIIKNRMSTVESHLPNATWIMEGEEDVVN